MIVVNILELEDFFPEKEPPKQESIYDTYEWLTPREVASIFGVDPKTVTKWARSGKLVNVDVIKTPGGHTRYRAAHIKKILEDNEDRPRR